MQRFKINTAMRIVHISNPKKTKALSYKQDLLSVAYMKDIRLNYNRHKNKLTELGVSEEKFIKEMKARLGL